MEEEIDKTVTRLISKVRTMAAMSYKISKGHGGWFIRGRTFLIAPTF